MKPPTTKEDIEAIRTVLKKVRNFAQSHRYGGWYEKWRQATAAIEALERVEKDLIEKHQLQLL